MKTDKIDFATEVLAENGPVRVISLVQQTGVKLWTLDEHTEELKLVKMVSCEAPCAKGSFYNVRIPGGSFTVPSDGLIWTSDGWHDLSCMRRGRHVKIVLPECGSWEENPGPVVPVGEREYAEIVLDEGTNVITKAGVVIRIGG